VDRHRATKRRHFVLRKWHPRKAAMERLFGHADLTVDASCDDACLGKSWERLGGLVHCSAMFEPVATHQSLVSPCRIFSSTAPVGSLLSVTANASSFSTNCFRFPWLHVIP
jgi:hypothetical protein